MLAADSSEATRLCNFPSAFTTVTQLRASMIEPYDGDSSLDEDQSPMTHAITRRHYLAGSLVGVLAAATGCRTEQPPTTTPAPAEEKPLRVLLVDAPGAYAEKLRRFWLAQTDAPFELRSITADEAAEAKRFKADVIVYPSRLLGSLASNERIAPLARSVVEGEALHAGDLLRHARTTEVVWGSQTMAVCLGTQTYKLLYRADVFAELNLTPPGDWAEYRAVFEKIIAAKQSWSHVYEPLADSPEQTLLARAAAYVRNRSDFGGLFDLKTMQPLVGAAPYVKALDELVEVHKLAGASERRSAQEAVARLLAGDAALVWGVPSSAVAANETMLADKIAIAPLPGSGEFYDFRAQKWISRGENEEPRVPLVGSSGVLASVTTEARRPKAAEGFLAWLSAGENSIEVAASHTSAAPFRKSHLDQPRAWLPPWFSADASQQYVAATRSEHDQATVLLSPRLPGESEYRAALRTAVEQTLSGEHNAVDALAAAAESFNTITDRLDRAAQRLSYQRSLGLDV